ncbi:cyclin-A1-1-like [Gossypium australe]|uniref:Cyclin-A1-1-like n=1 Tax=Gossypium australe TaxID=47621 RepID=A0A5B6VSW7_9ROSI|nr:cyclin-A1-1-like [Gossypium australe]
MTAPTAKCFLRRFVLAAQWINEVPSMQLECMANYIAELSLLEYVLLVKSGMGHLDGSREFPRLCIGGSSNPISIGTPPSATDMKAYLL